MRGGASLAVAVPDGWIDEPSASLPTIQLTGIAGASILVRAGVAGDGASLRVICATAPSSRWAPGVEALVLDRANQIARDMTGGLTRFEPSPIEARGDRFEQVFRGEGEARSAWGKHLLGFAGRDRDAVLCTVLCAATDARKAPCADLVASVRAAGTWAPAPSPSAGVRAILFAAERPIVAGAIAGLVVVLGIWLVLRTRPRPKHF